MSKKRLLALLAMLVLIPTVAYAATFSRVRTNTISEKTSGSGTTVESVLLKDGVITATPNITSALTRNVGGRVYSMTATGDSMTTDTIEVFTHTVGTEAKAAFAASELNLLGRMFRFRAIVNVTAQNSTDTFQFHVKLGGVSGDIIFGTDAFDLTGTPQWNVEGECYVTTAGASGVLYCATQGEDTDDEFTTTATYAAVSTVDLTAALDLVVTKTYSAASGNASTLEYMAVEVH